MSKHPVPVLIRRPMAMRDDGDAMLSLTPCRADVTRNLDVVSNDICVIGDPWLVSPMRLNAR